MLPVALGGLRSVVQELRAGKSPLRQPRPELPVAAWLARVAEVTVEYREPAPVRQGLQVRDFLGGRQLSDTTPTRQQCLSRTFTLFFSKTWSIVLCVLRGILHASLVGKRENDDG
jgi:hypothetical protein